MAQEIRVLTWCDVCQADDVQAEAVRLPLTLDDGKPREIDLCETHEKTLLQPLREALADHGHRGGAAPVPRRHASVPVQPRDPDAARLGRKPTKPRDHVCLWCGTEYAPGAGLPAHLVSVHGFPGHGKANAARIREVFGSTCPWCAKVMDSPLSFGSHVASAHPDVPGAVVPAFVAARDAGDPVGVVAKVMAKAPGGKYRRPRR